jgi:hypothetical protein
LWTCCGCSRIRAAVVVSGFSLVWTEDEDGSVADAEADPAASDDDEDDGSSGFLPPQAIPDPGRTLSLESVTGWGIFRFRDNCWVAPIGLQLLFWK